ncbi:MAG: hypothetical protein Q8O10_10120 [candidate division Zixibacteria bacterium]|nr:hypothetical protein [candidate division Zixibacteria bacterium]
MVKLKFYTPDSGRRSTMSRGLVDDSVKHKKKWCQEITPDTTEKKVKLKSPGS